MPGHFCMASEPGPQVTLDPGVITSPISAGYAAGVATDYLGNVYVSDQNAQTITKYPPSGSPVTLASGVMASGIAVDGLGDVYYGISNQNSINIIPANTTSSDQLATVSFPDNSLVVDGSANLYVPTGENGTIVKIAEGSNTASTIANIPERVIGMTIDARGNLYAAGFESNTIYKIAAGTYAVSTLTSGGYLNGPDGLAIDAGGNLYAANDNGGIVKLAAGTYAQTLLDSGYQALGLALDQAGNLYVGNANAGTVEKYNRNSVSLSFPTTAVKSTSSSQPVEISNIGNASLAMSGLSVASNFTQVEGSGNPEDCTSSLSLAAGASCNLSLSFAPTTPGTIQGTAVLTNNALNASSARQTINLNGTATDIVASFSITGLVSTTAGTGENFTITALDPQGNVDTNFSRAVSISSSDPHGGGTVNATLTNGVKSLPGAWKFQTAGSQTLTVTDSADSVVSTSAPVLITAGPAASIKIVEGTSQSATVNTAFATPLEVEVQDLYGNPVSGATVTFTAPSTGASAILSTSTPAVTAADGTTSVTAAANATSGSYHVNAAPSHIPAVGFALTNNPALQTITFTGLPTQARYGGSGPFTLNATASSGLTVSYSVTGPATLSGSMLTLTGAGTVTVTASQAGNATYAAATAVVQTITVTQGTSRTMLAVTSGGTHVNNVAKGSAVTLTATVEAGTTPVPTGAVNFCDASSPHCTDIHLLGTAQLTSAGTASMTYIPGLGNRSYKAVFVATASAAASSSPQVNLSVTGTYPTTTTIAQSGSAGNYSLTATVAGAGSNKVGPGGTVSFLDTSNGNFSLGSKTLSASTYTQSFAKASTPGTGSSPLIRGLRGLQRRRHSGPGDSELQQQHTNHPAGQRERAVHSQIHPRHGRRA